MPAAMRVEGDRELIKALEGLGDKVFRRVVRKAVGKGTKPIIKKARANLKSLGAVESKQLSKSLGQKTRTYKKDGVIAAVIGARSGFKIMYKGRPRDPVHYAHLVELGTATTPARPAMRSAFESEARKSLDIVNADLLKGVEREAAKLARKGKA